MSIAAKRPVIFGVIGWPLGHSLSPRIHEAGYHAAGIQARFVAIPAPDGPPALKAASFLGFRGLAVTLPHKLAAAAYCRTLDGPARRLGAANTVLFRPAGPVGFNTDVPALVSALKTLGRGRPFRVAAVLGAGGAARAALLALEIQGVRTIHVAARRRGQALSAAALLRKGIVSRAHSFNKEGLAEALEGADVVVNTTPMGMWPKTGVSPVPAGLLHPGLAVLETIYNPLETRLLTDARRRGCRTLQGWHMFLEQAALQFTLMTGRKAPRIAMKRELLKALRP